jgi:hypothetical protein
MSRPWIGDDSSSVSPVVRLETVGKTRALDAITLDIQGGRMVGLI